MENSPDSFLERRIDVLEQWKVEVSTQLRQLKNLAIVGVFLLSPTGAESLIHMIRGNAAAAPPPAPVYYPQPQPLPPPPAAVPPVPDSLPPQYSR